MAIDSNPAERALRSIGKGCEHWLFAVANTGAETLSRAKTIIDTAKLNASDPQAYLADIFESSHNKLNRLDNFLPWN